MTRHGLDSIRVLAGDYAEEARVSAAHQLLDSATTAVFAANDQSAVVHPRDLRAAAAPGAPGVQAGQ